MRKKEKPIPRPQREGVARTPVIMQMEALECGAASLCMVLAYYRKWVPLEQVRAPAACPGTGQTQKIYIRPRQATAFWQRRTATNRRR